MHTSQISDLRIKPFAYNQFAGRVVFGAGVIEQLPHELAGLGARRALVLSTPGQRALAETLALRLGRHSAGVFPRAVMHVPIEVVRAAREETQRVGADSVVAVGGGSTIGLGKAIALESGLPILAVPTTYAGSEMTSIYGITAAGLKRTGRDVRVLPRIVLYDPSLTLDLPVAVSVASGINAIAHAVEGLYSQDANPMTSILAEEGIRVLSEGLPRVARNSRDPEARSACLYGAWLCGTVLGALGMALHHKLCHTLGGTWNLPHAATHTVILPHTAAYNASAAAEAMSRVARALRVTHAPRGLYDLAKRLGASLALRDLGMQESELDRAAELATTSPYWNPHPIERSAIRRLLDNAFCGTPPA